MASAVEAGAKTPSPPPSLRTPPAPRLGFHDNWEPFSPRKSARISSQRSASARTPSPRNARKVRTGSPRSSDTAAKHSDGVAAISTPAMSPRKRPHPAALDTRRQVSGTLTAAGTANAAAALGLNPLSKVTEDSANPITSHATGMLPTPSKTPQKPPNAKTTAKIQSFARNLFHSDEENMPSPRKRRPKKYSGVTLHSFTAEEDEEPITIFTDSQDRVPEKDDSSENPFYGKSTAEPTKRKAKRSVVHVPGEGSQPIEEVVRRDDGMVYVFRGKKFFRPNAERTQAEEQDEPADDQESRLTRPLTRASVKPRLLFPTKKANDEVDEDDEEALTDVEDMHMGSEYPQTPQKSQSILTKTPDAPKFAPMSPPDTKRTTRSTNKLDKGTPAKTTGRSSPFDLWPRTKDNKTQGGAQKRQGEPLSSGSKRTRA